MHFGSRGARRTLGDVLVEHGIVANEQARGLEYAQRANDADVANIAEAERMMKEQNLDAGIALKAVLLAKRKNWPLQDGLKELGWKGSKAPAGPPPLPSQAKPPVPPPLPTPAGAGSSAFDPAELDAIKPTGNLARKSLWGVKAISAVEKAPANPIAALGSMKPGSPHLVHANGTKKDHPELIEEADHAFSRRNYELAETLYVAALEALECKPDSTLQEVSGLLLKTGTACIRIREFKRAEQYFLRAMKMRQLHAAGADDIPVAECLDHLAELYAEQSQLLQAEQYYLSALGIKEKLLSSGSSEVAESLKKLVVVSKRKGVQPEHKLSGELLTEAGLVDRHTLDEGLSIAKKSGVPIGRALVSLKHLTEEDLDAVVQAQLLLREGVVPGYVAVRALRLCSQQRIAFRQALQQIGLNPEDACPPEVFQLLDLARRLVAAERELTPDHPDIAALCTTLGELYMQQRRYTEAEQLLLRAASLAQNSDNADNALAPLARLGTLHFSQGNYVEAEKLLTRVVDQTANQATPTQVSAQAVETLAATRYVQRRFAESGQLYERALTMKRQLMGETHPELAPIMQGRANCYFAQGQLSEASELYHEAIQITELNFGFGSEHTAALIALLGDLLFTQKLFAEAQTEYLRCMDVIGNATNPDMDLFCAVLEKTARCSAEQNDAQRAQAYYQHYLKVRDATQS